MSRDVQVRVVFCDWLTWLLRMKKTVDDVSLASVIDKNQTENHVNDLVTFNSTEESIHHTCLTCNEVIGALLKYFSMYRRVHRSKNIELWLVLLKKITP